MSPFKSEKGTGWEGAFRVPCAVRWPGVLRPGTELNGIVAHHDWLPTLYTAASGDANVKEELLQGKEVAGTTYKVHLDGYNMVPYFKGEAQLSPREEFLYFGDDMSLLNLRWNDWKFTFAEQRAEPGTWNLWRDPFTQLRVPRIQNLRRDPFERAQERARPTRCGSRRSNSCSSPPVPTWRRRSRRLRNFHRAGLPANYSLSEALKSMESGSGAQQ